MTLKNHFELSRFWLLLKLELFRSRKGVLMLLVVMFGMLFFVGFLLDLVVDKGIVLYEHEENFASSLIIGGFILSSLAFNELSSTLKRYHYLTLPASTFEKLGCMWLLTSLGWLLVFTTLYTFYTGFANQIGPILFSSVTFVRFDPLGGFALDTMQYYFVSQGIFLVGATHFKGFVLPKTLFTLVLAALISGTLIFLILGDVFLGDHVCSSAEECELIEQLGMHEVWMILKGAFWWVLAPLSWVVAYLGLKEKEV